MKPFYTEKFWAAGFEINVNSVATDDSLTAAVLAT